MKKIFQRLNKYNDSINDFSIPQIEKTTKTKSKFVNPKSQAVSVSGSLTDCQEEVYLVFVPYGCGIPNQLQFPRRLKYKSKTSNSPAVFRIELPSDFDIDDIPNLNHMPLRRQIISAVTKLKSYFTKSNRIDGFHLYLQFAFDMNHSSIYEMLNLYPLVQPLISQFKHTIDLLKCYSSTGFYFTKSRDHEQNIFECINSINVKYSSITSNLILDLNEQLFTVGKEESLERGLPFWQECEFKAFREKTLELRSMSKLERIDVLIVDWVTSRSQKMTTGTSDNGPESTFNDYNESFHSLTSNLWSLTQTQMSRVTFPNTHDVFKEILNNPKYNRITEVSGFNKTVIKEEFHSCPDNIGLFSAFYEMAYLMHSKGYNLRYDGADPNDIICVNWESEKDNRELILQQKIRIYGFLDSFMNAFVKQSPLSKMRNGPRAIQISIYHNVDDIFEASTGSSSTQNIFSPKLVSRIHEFYMYFTQRSLTNGCLRKQGRDLREISMIKGSVSVKSWFRDTTDLRYRQGVKEDKASIRWQYRRKTGIVHIPSPLKKCFSAGDNV